MYDLVVIGGGTGGLATAALAQVAGLKVALLEAHVRLGGCAGFFPRGPYTFDAGATALMGLDPGEPLGDFLATIGADLEHVRQAGYIVHLPDRDLALDPDAEAFERACARVIPERTREQRLFWRLQTFTGTALLHAARHVPRLPLRSAADAWRTVRDLGPAGVAAGALSLLTVGEVLRLAGLNGVTPFRSLIAMLLQDTAQAGPDTVPFANAAACLQAYRLGMSRPVGGMRAFVGGVGERFAALGGDLRTGTIVDRVESAGPGGPFTVVTRRRERLEARQVALNLPLDRAAALLGKSLEGRLNRAERRSRAAWSAFTGYLVLDRDAVGDDSPLFHHVLQDYGRPCHDGNNALISLSPPGDAGYGPADVRVATMSTHTRPADWEGLDRPSYVSRKEQYAGRLLAALDRALPGASSRLRHAEFATPRSFARYTRRTSGLVGGPPVSRRNANLAAVGPDVFGPGVWVVGDSVFPGQGTLATVLSAIRVVEQVSGVCWASLRRPAPSEARVTVLAGD